MLAHRPPVSLAERLAALAAAFAPAASGRLAAAKTLLSAALILTALVWLGAAGDEQDGWPLKGGRGHQELSLLLSMEQRLHCSLYELAEPDSDGQRPLLAHAIPTQGPHRSPDLLPLLSTGQPLQSMAYLSIPSDIPAESFAVFVDGPEAFGIEPVNAIDAEHAKEIASALHPGSRLAAVPSRSLLGCNKHKVLADWLSTAEVTQAAR